MAGAFQGTTGQVPGSMAGTTAAAPGDSVRVQGPGGGRCGRCERIHPGFLCPGGSPAAS